MDEQNLAELEKRATEYLSDFTNFVPTERVAIEGTWAGIVIKLVEEVRRLRALVPPTLGTPIPLDASFYRPDRVRDLERRLADVEKLLAEALSEGETVEAQHAAFASKIKGRPRIS
jgi:hypothetical protein